MYTIAVDGRRRLVEVAINGFWTPEVFAAYAADLQRAIAKIPPSAEGHVTLADVSNASIQPQQLVEAFQRFIGRGDRPSRRIALYTDAVLPRMQCKRISGGNPNVQVFATREEAEAWLFDDQAAAA
jgi:hypothetical protein